MEQTIWSVNITIEQTNWFVYNFLINDSSYDDSVTA